MLCHNYVISKKYYVVKNCDQTNAQYLKRTISFSISKKKIGVIFKSSSDLETQQTAVHGNSSDALFDVFQKSVLACQGLRVSYRVRDHSKNGNRKFGRLIDLIFNIWFASLSACLTTAIFSTFSTKFYEFSVFL